MLKSLFKTLLINITTILIILLVSEFALRLTWVNPYQLKNDHLAYTRLHPAGLHLEGVVSELYPGRHLIAFHINDDYSLAGDFQENPTPVNIAVGGSTTECGLVPEGNRWPDLLNEPALNYGVSANTLIDGFYNLRYINETVGENIGNVFVMFAVNDLRAYLLKGHANFTREKWRQKLGNIADSIDDASRKVFAGLQLKQSYVLSFVQYYWSQYAGRDFYSGAILSREKQKRLDYLPDSDYEFFLREFSEQFLPKREEILEDYYRYTSENNINLIFLTQPHAFGRKFPAHTMDLRLYPVVDGKKMTGEQAAAVMDLLNNQTRTFSKTHNLTLIDVESCLEKNAPHEMFYDSVHYTLEGSKAFSECVNEALVAK